MGCGIGTNIRANATHQPSSISTIIAPPLARRNGVKQIAAAASNREPGRMPARKQIQ